MQCLGLLKEDVFNLEHSDLLPLVSCLPRLVMMKGLNERETWLLFLLCFSVFVDGFFFFIFWSIDIIGAAIPSQIKKKKKSEYL